MLNFNLLYKQKRYENNLILLDYIISFFITQVQLIHYKVRNIDPLTLITLHVFHFQ